MKAFLRIIALAWLALAAAAWAAAPQPVVIAHPSVPTLDAEMLQRLYTGRAITVDGQPVTVANAPAGSELRARFLELVLRQTDEKYTAYWIVRRHVGKGTPPIELSTTRDAVEFVRTTPGAIAYVPASELPPGTRVVFRPAP